MNAEHYFNSFPIGLRPTQEDRFVLCPKFFSEEATFCGVFDGTVGPDASDYVMKNITRVLCDSEEMQEVVHMINNSTEESTSHEPIAKKINFAMRNTFLQTDAALINMCTEKKLHYASSTGVAAFLWKNLLTIAHIGDSKACIAKVRVFYAYIAQASRRCLVLASSSTLPCLICLTYLTYLTRLFYATHIFCRILVHTGQGRPVAA